MLFPFPEESWAKAEPPCYTMWAELGSSAPCRLSEECTLIGGISTFLLTMVPPLHRLLEFAATVKNCSVLFISQSPAQYLAGLQRW